VELYLEPARLALLVQVFVRGDSRTAAVDEASEAGRDGASAWRCGRNAARIAATHRHTAAAPGGVIRAPPGVCGAAARSPARRTA
jgi:hypothetical protein